MFKTISVKSVEEVFEAVIKQQQWLQEAQGNELVIQRQDGKGGIRLRALTQSAFSAFPGSIREGEFFNEDSAFGDTTKITRGAVIHNFDDPSTMMKRLRTIWRRAAMHQTRFN